ncbi:MAG: helix-turn-helix transcriptional regulator [Eubacterium sp.]|nr:helix-turn-helix transcriptional regulator [Eubacterium sp.]
MLSKTSIVIMGILMEGGKNAYDILKMIDRMNMKYWLPIGATTLYETCLRLVKKGYIADTGETDSKAVYYITEEGRAELKKNICALYERVDFDSVWFCLAVMYSDILSKKELAAEKKKRKILLDEYEVGTKANKEKLMAENPSYSSICAIDRMLHIIEMEKETLKNL